MLRSGLAARARTPVPNPSGFTDCERSHLVCQGRQKFQTMTVPPTRPEKRRPAVMADVAELAGVSHQTVSRVLHDSPHVRGDTRERVLAAIRQLDYRPNSMARALAMGRSKTLGVVSFDTTQYGPASTLVGIERAAYDAGYGVSVSSLCA